MTAAQLLRQEQFEMDMECRELYDGCGYGSWVLAMMTKN